MPMSSCLTPGADHARQADLGSMSVEPVTGKAEQLVLLQAVTFDSSCCPRMLPQVLEHVAKIARINLICYDWLAEGRCHPKAKSWTLLCICCDPWRAKQSSLCCCRLWQSVPAHKHYKNFMTQILVVSEASVVAHAGQHRTAGVADAGGGSRQLLFASVYETFCKYCKGFYDNNPYCFRLKSSSSIILRSRSLSRSKSSSEESYFGS